MVVGLFLLLLGLAAGCACAWILLRRRAEADQQARAALETTFKALSADALRDSSTSFVELAKAHLETLQTKATADLEQRQQAVEQLVAPIKESLAKVDEHVRALEVSREGAYRGLHKQVEILSQSQERLRSETSSLVKALRAPASRGQWGEMQLRRALEMAGMLAHCDFVEQPTAAGEDGLLRPDVVVKLAGGKHLVVDAKVPLEALLDAFESGDDDHREARLQDFVR